MKLRALAFAASSVAMLATGVVQAQSANPADPDATAQGDLSVTIYNNGQA
ncbi:MAG: hypothetical protein RLZZ08_627, partial [Pseudomonadota bacterium]